MLNFGMGLMIHIFPQFSDTSSDTSSVFVTYNQTYADDFQETITGNVTPGSQLQDQSNAIYRVLDVVNLGFIARFGEIVHQYMFGSYYVLQNIFGSHITPKSLSDFIFNTLYTIIGIVYGIGLWYLWTNKDLR